MAARKKKQKDDDKNFMEETAEQDALEAKTGQAASHIKSAHLHAKEAEASLRCARMATRTHENIEHDLTATLDACGELKREAQTALTKLKK